MMSDNIVVGDTSSDQLLGFGPKWIILICLVTGYFLRHGHSNVCCSVWLGITEFSVLGSGAYTSLMDLCCWLVMTLETPQSLGVLQFHRRIMSQLWIIFLWAGKLNNILSVENAPGYFEIQICWDNLEMTQSDSRQKMSFRCHFFLTKHEQKKPFFDIWHYFKTPYFSITSKISVIKNLDLTVI